MLNIAPGPRNKGSRWLKLHPSCHQKPAQHPLPQPAPPIFHPPAPTSTPLAGCRAEALKLLYYTVLVSGRAMARTVQHLSLCVLASTFLGRGLRDLRQTCRSNKQNLIRSRESKASRRDSLYIVLFRPSQILSYKFDHPPRGRAL